MVRIADPTSRSRIGLEDMAKGGQGVLQRLELAGLHAVGQVTHRVGQRLHILDPSVRSK